MPILSLIIFTPILGALVIGLLPGEPLQVPRRAAFALSLIPFVLSLIMLAMFQPGVGDLQLAEKVSWIPSLGVNYSLGVDGFSLWLVIVSQIIGVFFDGPGQIAKNTMVPGAATAQRTAIEPDLFLDSGPVRLAPGSPAPQRQRMGPAGTADPLGSGRAAVPRGA